MYQMIELAEQVEQRGGTPLDPLEYKHQYLDRCSTIRSRTGWPSLRAGAARPRNTWCPARARCSKRCSERGLKMYLASGTDEIYMREEARLLDVDRYFDGGVYGALDDYKSFSKKILIQRLIASAECSGDQFLGFGDGYVEIEKVKEVGGVAVGVATDEPECLQRGRVEAQAPSGVGADFIMPELSVPRGTARRTAVSAHRAVP